MPAQVSVIIPAYNAAAYLAECLDSVLAQDVAGLEVIVVDDGSVDATRDVARRYVPAVRYVWQENSGGGSSPRNHGARLASSEFLAFFDADDVMCPGRLAAQLACLQRDTGLGLVLVDYRNFDESGDYPASHFAGCRELLAATGLQLPDGFVRLEPGEANRLLAAENFGITGALLLRRRAWVEAGGFDESLRDSEDFDLIFRLARSWPIGLLGREGFRRRMHAANQSSQTLRILEWKVASRTRLLERETDADVRALLRRSIASFELTRARELHDGGFSGARAAYWRALRRDPVVALAQWRILARTSPWAAIMKSGRSATE